MKQLPKFILLFFFLNFISYDFFAQNLIPFRVFTEDADGLYGFRDKISGEVVIPARYASASDFENQKAKVSLNGKHGYIADNGNILIPLIYDDLGNEREGLISAKKNGKYGFINPRNEIVVPFEYDFAFYFKDDLARVQKNNKIGFVDRNGKQVIPVEFEDAYSFHEGFAYTKKDGKYGFINKKGETVISHQFDDVKSFKDGLAVVKKDGKYGIINTAGKFVFEPQSEEMPFFSEGLAQIKIEEKHGFINTEGKIVIPVDYQEAKFFTAGKAPVKKDGKWLCIDKNNTVLFEIQGEIEENFRNGFLKTFQNKLFGLNDIAGKIILPNEYQQIGDFADGMAAVEKNKKLGCLSDDGTWFFEPNFDEISRANANVVLVRKDLLWGIFLKNEGRKIYIEPTYDEIETADFASVFLVKKGKKYAVVGGKGEYTVPFKIDEFRRLDNYLYAVKIAGKWGCVNEKGSLAIPAIYEEVRNFYQGLGVFKLSGRYGCLDTRGNPVVPFEYDYIFPLSENIFLLKKGDRYSYMTADGKSLGKTLYNFGKSFRNGFAAVNQNGKWGFINAEGKTVIQPEFDYLNNFSEKLAAAQKNGLWGYINEKGKAVISFQFADAKDFSAGKALVKKGTEWYFINQKGELLFDNHFEDAFSFRNGEAWVKEKDDWKKITEKGEIIQNESPASDVFLDIEAQFVWAKDYKSNKYGLSVKSSVIRPFVFDAVSATVGSNKLFVRYDQTWQYINSRGETEWLHYDDVDYGLMSGTAVLKKITKEGKVGYFDIETEKIVIPLIYDGGSSFHYKFKKGEDFLSNTARPVSGTAIVCRNGKWGIIDMKGDVVVPLEYDEADNFSEGFAKVRKGEKFGFINQKGEVVVPFILDEAEAFYGGLAKVKKDNFWGAININGDFSVKNVFDKIQNTNDLFIWQVKKGEKYGLIDLRKMDIPTEYFEAAGTLFINGFLEFKQDGKFGFKDKNLITVIPPQYDETGSPENIPIAVKKGDKWGFIDGFNNEVLPFIYDDAESFDFGGQARVKIKNEIFFINMEGKRMEERKSNLLDNSPFDFDDW